MPRKLEAKRTSAKKAARPTAAEVLAHMQEIESREHAFNSVCVKLAEFFDAGYIVGTWTQGGETFTMDKPIGNKYAVQGLVQEAANKYVCDDAEEDEEEEWKA
jgi:hypothetical protein